MTLYSYRKKRWKARKGRYPRKILSTDCRRSTGNQERTGEIWEGEQRENWRKWKELEKNEDGVCFKGFNDSY